MANKEQLALLQQGIAVWNQWRGEHEELIPDLRFVDLRSSDFHAANLFKTDLSGADLRKVHLSQANLSVTDLRAADLRSAHLNSANFSGADLIEADLREANLTGANLSGADLTGANLSGANLTRVNFREANLNEVDFKWADLSEANLHAATLKWADLTEATLHAADLSDTYLNRADLSGADLSQAIFTNAIFSWTTLGNVDFSTAQDLKSALHRGPSTIGIDTIYRSQGKIPESFLRGAGVPDTFIIYIHSLIGTPIQYYTCFISHSSKDQAFADRLYNDLQGSSVRCWYAPEDMKIGDKFRQRIDQAIRIHDKLLLVLSEKSVASQWVEREVEAAFDQEDRHGRQVLFPIRLDNAVKETDQAWAATIRRERHIGDFTQWKDHDKYQQAFTRLLRDLKASES